MNKKAQPDIMLKKLLKETFFPSQRKKKKKPFKLKL